ncbi:hypothetical protein CJ255_05385 [Candidatus Viridilinea mediisalina]|uniref:Uncharacterized protein n=1 Tax=Candidatus Viridilinea mediisalina TaxID=2024553 RepID=A0A2A6RMH9_9CHLR|nr:hypothetical protein CJ255_05385 [Candidatus Viridilinea mediisalina]
MYQTLQHGLPAGRRGYAIACLFAIRHLIFALGLLEGVVDGERISGVLHCSDALKDLAEPRFKEVLCCLAPAVAEGFGDQFGGLGHQHGAKEFRVDPAQCATEPDVEEVAEIGVGYVVVVGWIGGDDNCLII